MKQIKTSGLSGAALDYAVSLCKGFTFEAIDSFLAYREEDKRFSYSTDWTQGGPIVEREGITVGPYHGKDCQPTGVFQGYIGWNSEELEPLFQVDGPTPLIAAMRCYVASKLGDVVSVPDELA
jgi:hypothetical protein